MIEHIKNTTDDCMDAYANYCKCIYENCPDLFKYDKYPHTFIIYEYLYYKIKNIEYKFPDNYSERLFSEPSTLPIEYISFDD